MVYSCVNPYLFCLNFLFSCTETSANITQYIPFYCCWCRCSCQRVCSVLPWKCKNGFPLHCCWAAKYSVLLLKITNIKYWVCVCILALVIHHENHVFSAVLYWHLRPVWLHHIFPHYLIKAWFLGKKFIKHKMCYSVQLLSSRCWILRKTRQDIIILLESSCKVPVILVRF